MQPQRALVHDFQGVIKKADESDTNKEENKKPA